MTTGSQSDMLGRLKSLLPATWFPNPSGGPPILTAVLQAPSTLLSWVYSLLFYIKAQTRILTSSGAWLDLAAYDFFGGSVVRGAGQLDASFAAAIIARMLLIRNTRASITSALTTLTGNTPVIFEPWRLPDAASLNVANGYGLWRNVAGLRGSRGFPFVVFITIAPGSASNAAIYAALEAVRAAGITFWVQIT